MQHQLELAYVGIEVPHPDTLTPFLGDVVGLVPGEPSVTRDAVTWRNDCPVPMPRQVFAIGINYRSHAEETATAIPDVPVTFTKFPASLAGVDQVPSESGELGVGRQG